MYLNFMTALAIFFYSLIVPNVNNYLDKIRQYPIEEIPNNAEYGECSNALYFTLLGEDPELFMEALSQLRLENKKWYKYIIHDLETPVHDGFDLQEIRRKVYSTDKYPDIRAEILNSLAIAIAKDGHA